MYKRQPYQSEFSKKLLRGPKYAELEEAISKDYHVRFYDLDMNGHVNNSKYLDWVFEVMGADFLTNHIPKKINLKYVKEVRPGGMITSSCLLYTSEFVKTEKDREGNRIHWYKKVERCV